MKTLQEINAMSEDELNVLLCQSEPRVCFTVGCVNVRLPEGLYCAACKYPKAELAPSWLIAAKMRCESLYAKRIANAARAKLKEQP